MEMAQSRGLDWAMDIMKAQGPEKEKMESNKEPAAPSTNRQSTDNSNPRRHGRNLKRTLNSPPKRMQRCQTGTFLEWVVAKAHQKGRSTYYLDGFLFIGRAGTPDCETFLQAFQNA
ncbi:hypothetical protein NDU88_002083 [Pleurodeles waltl]|uniref:Uncharacterized protein n=1 Tax=Pleurodeles waltl TaxID=8319 RepID=A0AAV7KR96_PLEWA|nr:hypothetical protein NDU88_002083 [Pleurodeles waltl]